MQRSNEMQSDIIASGSIFLTASNSNLRRGVLFLKFKV